MEADDGQDSPTSTVAAASLTAVIARRVRELRQQAEMSGSRLAAKLNELGVAWNRTTIAKFETGQRATISVQELLALAIALDVPPMMLLADPRSVDEVPVARDITKSAWDALLWLSGTGTIDKSNLNNFAAAAWLIQAGVGIVENLVELQKYEQVLDLGGDPEAAAERAQQRGQRDAARHRDALRAIRTAVTRIRSAGAPLPPLPVDLIRQRARELDVDMPDLEA